MAVKALKLIGRLIKVLLKTEEGIASKNVLQFSKIDTG